MDAPCEIPYNFCVLGNFYYKNIGKKYMPVVFYEENTLY